MSKTAFVFPGQGAQAVRMGAAVYEKYTRARDMYSRADELLDFNLTELCFNGPEEQLNSTRYSQPAILVTSLAILEVVRNETRLGRTQISVPAGLSLGEYTALVFAGVMRFADAVKLVYRRGQAMEKASKMNPGSMTSILGLNHQQVEEVVEKAKVAGRIAAANYNSPEQVVISGEVPALEEAERLAKDAGAKMAVRLKVSGAFHSELMAPAAEELKQALEEVELSRPQIPVVSNVTGDYLVEPEQIKHMLVAQLDHPVKWCQSMERLIEDGVRQFYEVGPGRVLTGLAKRINRKVGCESINDANSLAALSE